MGSKHLFCPCSAALQAWARAAMAPPTNSLLQRIRSAGVSLSRFVCLCVGQCLFKLHPICRAIPRRDGDANATVAAAVSSAVATYIKMAIAGGVAQARIDNADSYQNVAAVGRGMADSGVPRASIWLLSKVGNGLAMGFQDTLDQFASICATQNVTYVDALLNHWPTATAASKEAACNSNDPAFNATLCRLDTWRALVQIFNSGGAKSIGVSNYLVEHLEEIRLAGMVMPAINQIPIHIYRSSSWAETIDYCQRHGIVVNSYSPLSVPDWHVFPTSTGMSATALVDPVVTAVAAAHARSPAAVILNWLWQLGFVSNPRTYNPAHMDDDLNAYNFDLTPVEVAQLSARPQSWCSVDNWYECAPDKAAPPASPFTLREVRLRAMRAAGSSCARSSAREVLRHPQKRRSRLTQTPTCGNLTKPLSAGKKNILLIGDSISMTPPYTPGGYGHALEELLTARGYAVQHAGGDFGGGQGGDSEMGVLCTNESYAGGYFAGLPDGAQFDLIHFNYGLHDLANYSPALPPTPLPKYGENLATIFKVLARHSKLQMWTSTTPCPNVTTSYDRSYDKVVAYNARAVEALQPLAKTWLIDDLFKAFIGFCGDHYKSCSLQLPANVHLTPAGIAFAAAHAADSIVAALQAAE